MRSYPRILPVTGLSSLRLLLALVGAWGGAAFAQMEGDSTIAADSIIHLGTSTIQSQHTLTSRQQLLSEEQRTLRGARLDRLRSGGLAESLGELPGVALRSMGPAPARPVLRGMGGEHVVLIESENRSTDLSGTSPDHAIPMDAHSADGLELVRGPQLLLYGPATGGGVLKTKTYDAHTGQGGVSGEALLSGESAQPGAALTTRYFYTQPQWGLSGELTARRAGDTRTPLGAQPNTSLETDAWSAGAVRRWGSTTWKLHGRHFASEYGIPGGFLGAHPHGVQVLMEKQSTSVQMEHIPQDNSADTLSLHGSVDTYAHSELEGPGMVGADFRITHSQARWSWHHGARGLLGAGVLGIALNHRLLTMGGFVFTPNTHSAGVALFGVDRRSLRPGWQWENGMRLELNGYWPDSNSVPNRRNPPRDRQFATLSAATQLVGRLAPGWNAGLGLHRSHRAPSVEELYNQGPHLAAYSFDMGDADLPPEVGHGVELSQWWRKDSLSLTATAWWTHYHNYLIPRNTGDTNWSKILPIYATQGHPARNWGAEVSAAWHHTSGLFGEGNGSWVRGAFASDQKALPGIPPPRLWLTSGWRCTQGQLGLVWEGALVQNRVDEYESPTAGYQLWHLRASLNWGAHSLHASIDNLTDVVWYNHLSRLRVILPEKGRNFKGVYRVGF